MRAGLSHVKRYALVSALTWLPAGLHLPVMVLLMTARGLSLAEVGFVVTAHSVLVVALELPTGALSDALGRRSVLAAAAALNLVAFGLTAIASTTVLFAAAAALKGVGRALSSGPAEAWYVDSVHATDPHADLRSGLAVGQTASSAALAFGVLVGGFVPLGLGAAGWRPGPALAVPAGLACLASGLLLAVVLVALPEPAGRANASVADILAATPRVAVRGVLLFARDPVLRLLILSPLVLGAALNVIELLTPGRIAALAGAAADGAAGYAVIAAIGFVASALGSGTAPLIGRYVRTAPLLAATGVAVTAAGAFALAGTSTTEGTAGYVSAGVAYFTIFAGLGLASPAVSELLNGRAAAGERATVLSVNSLALQFGGIVSALTLVPLADRGGPGLAWAIAGGLLSGAVGVFFALRSTGVASVTVVGVTASLDDDGADARILSSGSVAEPVTELPREA